MSRVHCMIFRLIKNCLIWSRRPKRNLKKRTRPNSRSLGSYWRWRNLQKWNCYSHTSCTTLAGHQNMISESPVWIRKWKLATSAWSSRTPAKTGASVQLIMWSTMTSCVVTGMLLVCPYPLPPPVLAVQCQSLTLVNWPLRLSTCEWRVIHYPSQVWHSDQVQCVKEGQGKKHLIFQEWVSLLLSI